MKIIIHWLIISGAVYGLAYFLPDISVSPWWVALIVGAVLYFIHSLVKPIIKILTLPITLVTFGMFSIALNLFFFWFPSYIIEGFEISTWKALFIGAVAISLVNWLADKITDK
ncbi:MAG TPA: phage holin family protein [Candidatus Paceibacterota bacterium]